MGVFVFLFYPPLIIFYGLALAEKVKINLKYATILISIASVIFLILMISPAEKFLEYILSNIFYKSFTGNFIPQFNPLFIIPFWSLVFAVFGFKKLLKENKWLFAQIILGFCLWFFYMFSTYRIFIGYERTVYYVSILIILCGAYGIDYLEKNFNRLAKPAEALAVVLFFVFLPFYTQGENWSKLILSHYSLGADSIPKAPANNYLQADDLRIFKNIKEKRFFSNPWKGTVIGVATGNYPVLTKGGTITMDPKNPKIYNTFMSSDCEIKTSIAKQRNVDYVYSMPFSCLEFEELDKSSEGYVLYKFKNQ